MVRPSVLRVKSRLLSPLSGWSHVLLINRRSMAPVYRNFVKCTAPRGLRAVKSMSNPGFGRVKPPLCSGARGRGGAVQLTDTLPFSSLQTMEQLSRIKQKHICTSLISCLPYECIIWFILQVYIIFMVNHMFFFNLSITITIAWHFSENRKFPSVLFS